MTIRNRAVTGAVTSLAALMMLTGCQSSSSGDGSLGSSETTSTSSSSSGASASSKSPKPSPKPTGAQVVQIGGPDSKDTKETARKEAFEAVQQYNRVQNAWGSSEEELKNYSDDELKKFTEGDALKQLQEAHARMVDSNLGFGTGQVEVGLLDMDNAGLVDFGNGKTWEHGSVQLRVCEDWSRVRNADGSKSIPDDKAKRVIRASVVRGEDGYYYLRSYRVDHYGCD